MKKLLIALLVFGLIAPGMAMAQDMDQRVTELEENMEELTKEGMKLKEAAEKGPHFYGRIRPQVGYYSTGDDWSGGDATALDTSITGPDDEGLAMNLTTSTRLGAKVMVSDSVTALYEMGFYPDTGKVNTRLAWGTWDFGGGEFSVGQYYTPATFLGYSAMTADIGDGGYGNLLLAGMPYINRKPQVRLSFGDFDIALIQKSLGAVGPIDPGSQDPLDVDVDSDLPRIEAAYVVDLDMVSLRPIAGFQTYDAELNGDKESIVSYLLGLGASLDFDPAYVKMTGSYLQNASNYGDLSIMSGGLYSDTGWAFYVDGDVEDSKTIKGTLVGGFDVNEDLNIEGGIGYMNGEVDVAQDTTFEETAYVYYLQSRIGLAEGFDMYPGIGMVDLDEEEIGGDKTDRGDMVYVNVSFDVHF